MTVNNVKKGTGPCKPKGKCGMQSPPKKTKPKKGKLKPPSLKPPGTSVQEY